MSVGIVSPTAGYSEDQFVAAQEAAANREAQRGMWHASARDLLGYAQDRNGLWRQRAAEQVSGFPPALIDAARAACQAETAAHQALEAAHNTAMAYITKHQLSPEAAQVHLELARAETWTAYHEAARAAVHACARLGEAVEDIRARRAVIDAAPQQLATIDAWAQAQRDQVEKKVEAARQGLLRWGAL